MRDRTTDLEKIRQGHPFSWGRVLQIHDIGPYTIVEAANTFNGRPGTEKTFHAYVAGSDTCNSFPTLDTAIVGCVAIRAEGGSSRAVPYLAKMLGLSETPEQVESAGMRGAPEILSIEEVRKLAAAIKNAKLIEGPRTAISRLCVTVEHWHAETARLQADVKRRREIWQGDFQKLQRAEMDRDLLETERDRLRALVGRMLLEMAALSVPEGWTLRRSIAEALTDPDGQQAAEELRQARERADGLAGKLDALLGNGHTVESLAEELRLLREWEAAMVRWFEAGGGFVRMPVPEGSAHENAKIKEEEAWSALRAFREANHG